MYPPFRKVACETIDLNVPKENDPLIIKICPTNMLYVLSANQKEGGACHLRICSTCRLQLCNSRGQLIPTDRYPLHNWPFFFLTQIIMLPAAKAVALLLCGNIDPYHPFQFRSPLTKISPLFDAFTVPIVPWLIHAVSVSICLHVVPLSTHSALTANYSSSHQNTHEFCQTLYNLLVFPIESPESVGAVYMYICQEDIRWVAPRPMLIYIEKN